MTSPASTPFATANQHALATILDAAQTKRIIASSDIFDISGIKLWARDMPVSTSLQRKLLDRQLRNPLESCLMAEDGVTVKSLAEAIEALVEADTPLAALLRPRAAKLVPRIAKRAKIVVRGEITKAFVLKGIAATAGAKAAIEAAGGSLTE